MKVDLRSDTITRPTEDMLQAMVSAPLGDDVFGDDPTVNALQEKLADLMDKEAALFVPSGTMANQVCIRSHTEPGDEMIVEAGSHIFLYEGGGYAALAGVSIRTVPAPRGILSADDVLGAVRPPGGMSHFPPTRLVCLENSANRGGGSLYTVERTDEIAAAARTEGLKMHLDGARLFNAAVALADLEGVNASKMVQRLAAPFDSVSVCLSKGLGCPVGSLVVGSRSFVDRAHRFRKMLGGGMRQAGVLAAAGIYALDHHVERLADDHGRARAFAESVASLPGVAVDLDAVQSNMVYVDVGDTGISSADFLARLSESGVELVAVSPTQLRAVFHLDVDDEGLFFALKAFTSVLR
jgi:threonine aldolase